MSKSHIIIAISLFDRKIFNYSFPFFHNNFPSNTYLSMNTRIKENVAILKQKENNQQYSSTYI